MILEYLCIMEKPHPRMVLMVLYLPALITCLLSLLLLFCFSAPMDIQISCQWMATSCQVSLTVLSYSGGCPPIFVSCFPKSLVSCLQESKVKPESYRLRRWLPHSLEYLFCDPAVAEVCAPVQRNHLPQAILDEFQSILRQTQRI